jgi:hypothetical protein
LLPPHVVAEQPLVMLRRSAARGAVQACRRFSGGAAHLG